MCCTQNLFGIESKVAAAETAKYCFPFSLDPYSMTSTLCFELYFFGHDHNILFICANLSEACQFLFALRQRQCVIFLPLTLSVNASKF